MKTTASNAARTQSVTSMEIVNAIRTGTRRRTVVSLTELVILTVLIPVPDHMPTTVTLAGRMLIVTSTDDVYAMITGADQTVTSSKATATAHAAPASAHRPPTVLIVRDMPHLTPMPSELALVNVM